MPRSRSARPRSRATAASRCTTTSCTCTRTAPSRSARIGPRAEAMKDSLRPGLEATFRYPVPASKTVPRIYPEAADFQLMPEVLATGYLVALCEWACVELVKPHLD